MEPKEVVASIRFALAGSGLSDRLDSVQAPIIMKEVDRPPLGKYRLRHLAGWILRSSNSSRQSWSSIQRDASITDRSTPSRSSLITTGAPS